MAKSNCVIGVIEIKNFSGLKNKDKFAMKEAVKRGYTVKPQVSTEYGMFYTYRFVQAGKPLLIVEC